MAGTEIHVDPTKLRQAASEIDKVHGSYRTYLEQAAAESQKLKGVWTGEAATAYLTSFESIKANCETYLETLRLTSKSLYETADTYEQSVKNITSQIENMPKLPSNTMR